MTDSTVAWVRMHMIVPAAIIWTAAIPVLFLGSRATVPPLLARPSVDAEVPAALMLPLVGAAAASFAITHGTPLLLATAGRRLLAAQLVWALAALLPGLILAALTAVRSQQVTVGAATRNTLLLAAIAIAVLRWLPPGLSVVPAAAYELACIVVGVAAVTIGRPYPWWAVAMHRNTSPVEVVLAAMLCLSAIVMHSRRQARGH